MSKLKPSNFSKNILKTHIVTKLKNFTSDKTQKLKLREHPQIQIEAKSKTLIVTTLRMVNRLLEGLKSFFWGKIGVGFNFKSMGVHYKCNGLIMAAHLQLKVYL